MKATELRVGNWYRFDGPTPNQFEQIEAQDIVELQDDPCEDAFKPIPITEEWLVKFGFEKRESIWTLNEICISSWFSFRYSEDPLKVQEIDFVHQLQNLYFALTGKELTT